MEDITRKCLFAIIIISIGFSQDCTADDSTNGLIFWNNCYSIENTTYLNLNYNGITGDIPSALWGLNNLIFIELGGNELVGEIPSEIGNLIDLEFLYLYENQLTGLIPDELYSLTNLKQISLWSNSFNGEISENIPQSICNINLQ